MAYQQLITPGEFKGIIATLGFLRTDFTQTNLANFFLQIFIFIVQISFPCSVPKNIMYKEPTELHFTSLSFIFYFIVITECLAKQCHVSGIRTCEKQETKYLIKRNKTREHIGCTIFSERINVSLSQVNSVPLKMFPQAREAPYSGWADRIIKLIYAHIIKV